MSNFKFHLVPPERGRRKGSVVAYCSTCCCCCCLHTIGGAVGAAAALSKDLPNVPESVEPPRVGKLYWTCVFLAGVPFLLAQPGAGLLAYALALPILQLVGSVIAAIYLSVKSPPNVDLCQAQLWMVTKWAFSGALIGLLPMLLLLGVMK